MNILGSSAATTSSQKPPEARPAQPEPISQDTPDLVEITPRHIPTARVSPNVKLEPLTPEVEQQLSNSSDVICMGSAGAEEIVITDTQDHDFSLIQSLQQPDDDVNPFLKQIEEGTQPEETAAPKSAYSNETLIELLALEPQSVRHARSDKEQEAKQTLEKAADVPRPAGRRPGPFSRTRSASRPGHINYLDDDSQPGNDERADQLQDHSIDDFSVFLSSQLIEAQAGVGIYNSAHESTPFTFAEPSTTNQVEYSTHSSCFGVQLVQVSFEKNIRFHLHVNLPQYSLYDITIPEDHIKTLIDISDVGFKAMLDLLATVEKYEFHPSAARREKVVANQYIVQQLDLFFANIKFKPFQLQINDDVITCVSEAATIKPSIDVTSSIDPSVLSKLSSAAKNL